MKILRIKETGKFKAWPRDDNNDILELDTDVYDVYNLTQLDKPEVNTDTHYLQPTEVVNEAEKNVVRGWESVEKPAPPDYKIWPNVQQFMAEFTMDEKAAVSMSADPIIAALRLELSTWFSEVHANDQRVVMGLDKLVELGIITPERKAEILTV